MSAVEGESEWTQTVLEVVVQVELTTLERRAYRVFFLMRTELDSNALVFARELGCTPEELRATLEVLERPAVVLQLRAVQ